MRSHPARYVLTAVALLAAGIAPACEAGDGSAGGDAGARDGGRAPAGSAAAPSDGTRGQEAAFAVRGGVLVRRGGEGERPLLALDSAAAPEGVPAVPSSWRPAPDVTFGIHATSFRHVVPSPDGRWVAWEAGSTHDLVGVVPADGGSVTVLDFLFDSSAEALTWAPAGRYLAVHHLPPSGFEEVRVYDAGEATRLRTPWGESCRARDGCRVTSAEWTDRTTLTVTTADGESSRYEADVSALPTAASDGRGG